MIQAESSLILRWVIFAGVVLLIIFPLWAINVMAHYNELKKKKAPQPFLILIKQLSLTKLLLSFLGLLPINESSFNRLKGRSVWLEWDIRWVGGDEVLGKIEEVLINPSGHALLIRVGSPIKFFGNSINGADEIIFEPRSRINLAQYCNMEIYGTLLPKDDIKEVRDFINKGGYISCRITIS